jgi:hypothetical protein
MERSVKTTIYLPSTRESREMVGRVETSVGKARLVANSIGLNELTRLVERCLTHGQGRGAYLFRRRWCHCRLR